MFKFIYQYTKLVLPYNLFYFAKLTNNLSAIYNKKITY